MNMITSRIYPLNSLLANQIAAGEVVERPASVVKELLENSLDAGATRIEIELEKGGKQLIRIQDNGSGIHPDDLALAASRHATSKISSLEDLAKIQSLGFRGEALASIAAVSRFRLISATAEHQAQQLKLEGEDLRIQTTLAAHPRGTTVEVRELFFNAPVRRRFLRSDKTEFSHILEMTKKIALSRNDVVMTLTHNKKLILSLPAATNFAEQINRVAKICGKNFIQKSQHFSEEAQGLLLQGWITCANESYPHANIHYFFLNGRVIRDKLINHALRVAAQDFLPAGRYLAYVLYFNCSPELVDINVHPTKHEVRFQESRLVHDFIVHVLGRIWQQNTLKENPIEYVGHIIAPMETTQLDPVQAQTSTQAQTSARVPALNFHAAAIDHSNNNKQRFAKHDVGRVISLVHQHYLLVEIKSGLTIINCIAANELIYLHQLRSATLIQPLASKALLWPVSLNVTAMQIQALQAQEIDWQSVGIDWQLVGKHQIILRQLPIMLANSDYHSLFMALSATHTPLATIARYAAQSQTLMSTEQSQQLLEKLADFSEAELKKIWQVIHLT